MMRFLLSLLAASFLLIGCGKYRVVDTFYAEVEIDFPMTEAVAYELAKITAEMREDNFNINTCHSKAYRRIDGSFYIWVNFYSMEILEVNEARHVMADLVADILIRCNENPTLKKYLVGNPLEVSNLRVSIDYESFFGRFVDPRLVGRTELNAGYLTAYYAHSALDADSIIFQQFFEPFITTAMLTRVDRRVAEEMKNVEPSKDLLDILQQDKWRDRNFNRPPLPDRVEYEDNGKTNYYPRKPATLKRRPKSKEPQNSETTQRSLATSKWKKR